jgi:hypothetical protein
VIPTLCAQCGKEVPEGATHCPHCGTPLAAVPPPAAPVVPVKPDRGVMILVFGILGIVCCVAFGIAAWVMGNGDLSEMDAGRMDATGRGLTTAGKIIGIVSVALAILSVVGWVIMLAIGIALPEL